MSSTTKKLQVFISSTYLDLKAERQAAVEAILKAGHIPAGMELFSAGSESQLETIKRWIDGSDVYMLILGGRYGSVEPKTSLSYTELEYDYAASKTKPLFSIVITDLALQEKIKATGKDAIETDNTKELKLFREKVLGRTSSFFSDNKDIKLAVHETLADFQNRFAFDGWVSGKSIADISLLTAELASLRSERDEAISRVSELQAAAEKVAAKSASEVHDSEFEELINILQSIQITTTTFNKSEDETPQSFTVLELLDHYRDPMIRGIPNKAGMSDTQKLLFFNIFPKLDMYGLATLEKVTGVQWKNYTLTPKGKALLMYVDRKRLRTANIKTSTSSPGPSAAASPASPPRKRIKKQ